MSNNYISQTNVPDLFQTLKSTENNILYNRLNCVRVAIVDEFFSDNLTVRVNIANKQVRGLNQDGSQILADYPPIYAKVHFFGWGDVGATYPITKGMEGILLFSDREVESWFINGSVNPLAYDRSHSKTDALFICGLHSMPNMITFVHECLNLFYKNTYIRLSQHIDDEEKTVYNAINSNVQLSNIKLDEFIEKNEDEEIIKITNSVNATTAGSTIDLKRVDDIEEKIIADDLNINTVGSTIHLNRTHNTEDDTYSDMINVSTPVLNEKFEIRNVEGDTIVEGNVTQEGNLVITGDLTVNGDIICTGTITASTDVIADGISLKNHTHTSSSPGDPTSPPIGG